MGLMDANIALESTFPDQSADLIQDTLRKLIPVCYFEDFWQFGVACELKLEDINQRHASRVKPTVHDSL
jgi:hypothetical protein